MGWKLSDLAPFSHRESRNCKSPGCEKGSYSMSPPDEEPQVLTKASKRSFPVFSLGTAQDTRSSSSGPLPVTSDPTILSIKEFIKKGRYRVKIRKGTKKKNLFRFLLAKLIYEADEGLHLDEFLVLWELLLDLQDLSNQDPSFEEKYGNFFKEDNRIFFKKISLAQEFPIRIEADPKNTEILISMFEPLLPSRSAYFGLKGQKEIRSGFLISFTSELPLRKIPEGRRIGVGYRDKGSRRDPALDGSPDWREVSQNSQEHIIRSVEILTGVDRDDPAFNWDLVNNPTKITIEKEKTARFVNV